MKNIILALLVLLTTTTISQELFNNISWQKLDNGEYRTIAQEKTSGKIYYTSLPDSVIKDSDFNGEECIIIVYNHRKDNVDFFPIVHKLEKPGFIIYDCYNARINVKFTYDISNRTYTALFISSETQKHARIKYYLETN